MIVPAEASSKRQIVDLSGRLSNVYICAVGLQRFALAAYQYRTTDICYLQLDVKPPAGI